MVLRRENVTSGSRVMLPAYAGLFTILGFLVLLQPPARFSSPVFDVGRAVSPEGDLRWWALLFLGVAALEIVALVVHDRWLYLVGLSLGVLLSTFWGGALLCAAFLDPHASYTSGVWVIGWSFSFYATSLTLARKERGVTPRR